MGQTDSNRPRLPKGVAALRRPRGGRGFRASIRKEKGVIIHLGLYSTPWLAAFAYGIAAKLSGRPEPHLEIPLAEQPDAEVVREITARVRRRLGIDKPSRYPVENAPDTEELLTLFEITVVGFWRSQAAVDVGGHPGSGLDAAAGRLVDAARILFWSRSAGHPDPLEAMCRLLGRRLEQTFRRADLTREVLNDDGDDPWRVARWLVHPDILHGHRIHGFAEEIRRLYLDFFETSHQGKGPAEIPTWARILGVGPPFDLEKIRSAYRAKSRKAHPDTGGTNAEFVRLREAFEAAMTDCGFP